MLTSLPEYKHQHCYNYYYY